MFNPRPSQVEVLNYQSGWMGVSAVPGSGKTHTLSSLAARLIAEDRLAEDQEILIVTLVNSAVDNFSSRIASFLRGVNLIPGMGYRVRTLHGLAYDIIRERPDLVGLGTQFGVIEDRERSRLLMSSANAWMRANTDLIQSLTRAEADASTPRFKQEERWNKLVVEVGGAWIRKAKDLQLSPAQIEEALSALPERPWVVDLGCKMYADFERALRMRGELDFDDLIQLALEAIQRDPEFLARLRHRWPYILEDEAQDSSRLQEEILRLLSGPNGNWVRVGDPNQAIYETFTTANPQYLRNFLRDPQVRALTLPNSGRSARRILDLANHLIEWTLEEHPVPELREALAPPYIFPTPPGDPQPNPPDAPNNIYISRKRTSDEELTAIQNNVQKWLVDHPNQTVAVLFTSNRRAFDFYQKLVQADIPCVELLQSSAATRDTAVLLHHILTFLVEPTNVKKIVSLYTAWGKFLDQQAELNQNLPVPPEIRQAAAKALTACSRPERYIQPAAFDDWLREQEPHLPPPVLTDLALFRERLAHWAQAVSLPVDQLVLTLAQDLFSDPAELALTHKIAQALQAQGRFNPAWDLRDHAAFLQNIAMQRQKFLGLSEQDTGFDPDQYPGKVLITTYHKAKGLEWDRVYLTGVNNYDFPSAQSYDEYQSEPYYIEPRLNWVAEALQRLEAVAQNDLAALFMEEGPATQEARYSISGERLRLLYVGITRARRELLIFWNTGSRKNCLQALPLAALESYWRSQMEEDAHAPSA